ncbi:hypothetical protein FIBSPDRAFT_976479 [Athelia psychrophila]|uniref:DUF6593 domain-containing protein n=1 Tax=Athelia psychrophila TaxID=1759441 RepID=A0A166ET01_9AGAM|nr:hypothetical protein FIBSPDRAFT_976479 [Fibularhizoctonia sp. CBS 109695]
MNFTLTDTHTTNTDFIGPDGYVYYRIETPWKMFAKSTRVTAAREGGTHIIGTIEWHSFGNTALTVGGRQIVPLSSGMLSHSHIFKACNGVEYKWKEIGNANVLVVKGQSGFSVATFQRASGGLFSTIRPASLSVSPQGIPIGDDIVMTAIWFEEKRHRREQRSRSNNAASSNNSNMAMNMQMQNNISMSNGMSNGMITLQIFTACDGLEYKWNEKGRTNVLTSKGQSDVSIATFQRASNHIFSANKPASLSVAPQGMHTGGRHCDDCDLI